MEKRGVASPETQPTVADVDNDIAPISEPIANPLNQEFLVDVWQGLSVFPKNLPCKYFYDAKGSELFEAICATPEYYVKRTEWSIFQQHAADMALYIGAHAHIVEPGAGAVQKIALLLAELDAPASYIPLDISPEMLTASSSALAKLFPFVPVTPQIVDFLNVDDLMRLFQSDLPGKRLIFFPGSTVGNFHPVNACQFLKNFSLTLNSSDGLLIGVDLRKSTDILESAYNDKEGVTAAFNLNLLHRINRELGADFDVDQFAHKAIFNEQKSRIEMHLVSQREQSVTIADKVFNFAQDETIHTENSYKYSVTDFTELMESAGFSSRAVWTDEQELFSVHYAEVQ